uniref:FAD_binding_3 domain-containing protein n=1 Tax=Trichuris muris TaxID=70415 RepID=A0A5S6Q442_TRIMR
MNLRIVNFWFSCSRAPRTDDIRILNFLVIAKRTEGRFKITKSNKQFLPASRVRAIAKVAEMFNRFRSKLFSACAGRAFTSLRHFCDKVQHYDIAIVGGGMVGSAVACAAGTSDLLTSQSVVLVDSAKSAPAPKLEPRSYSNFVCAISPRSVEFFKTMGVWQDIRSARAQEVTRMVVWEDCSDAYITFAEKNTPPDEKMPLAYIIENQVILQSLRKRISESSNVTVRNGVTVKSYNFPDNLSGPVELALDNGEVIRAQLLVAADGYNSSARDVMGVHVVRFSYGQKCIVANLKLLPQTLSGDMSSLTWANDEQTADRLMEMTESDFADELNVALMERQNQSSFTNSALTCGNALWKMLPFGCQEEKVRNDLQPPTIVSVEKRATIPLQFVHATHYYSDRSVLVGDAAHRVHPLAGLGVNLGFGDAQVLAQVLEEAISVGDDIGTPTYLRKYQTTRQREVLPIALGCDALYRLYSTSVLPAVFLRSLGLNLVNKLPFVKNFFLDVASRPRFVA